jgi:hypothetical protein
LLHHRNRPGGSTGSMCSQRRRRSQKRRRPERFSQREALHQVGQVWLPPMSKVAAIPLPAYARSIARPLPSATLPPRCCAADAIAQYRCRRTRLGAPKTISVVTPKLAGGSSNLAGSRSTKDRILPGQNRERIAKRTQKLGMQVVQPGVTVLRGVDAVRCSVPTG